jgi:hypothetical protein
VALGVATTIRIIAWVLKKDIRADEGHRWGGAFVKVEYHPEGEYDPEIEHERNHGVDF